MPARKKSTRKAKPAAPAKRTRSSTSAKSIRSVKTVSISEPPKKTKPAKRAKAATSAKEAAPVVRRTSAELHFTETTIIRGDAVEAGQPAPSGATHEIAGHDAAGLPILKRKRFSIF